MGVAEEGFDGERLRQVAMKGEFRTVVEGNGLPGRLRQRTEDPPQHGVRFPGRFGLQGSGNGEAGLALAERQ